MPSSKDLAKIIAGTFVEDSQGKAKENPVFAWIQEECRAGSLRSVVEAFVDDQPEMMDPALVLVDSVCPTHIECVIPCRVADHESSSTFLTEVRFWVNPKTFHVERLLSA